VAAGGVTDDGLSTQPTTHSKIPGSTAYIETHSLLTCQNHGPRAMQAQMEAVFGMWLESLNIACQFEN
jgi:hypothetical protein